MTTTTLTEHDLLPLKTQVGKSWPDRWSQGEWVQREDTMVFLVDGRPRAFMPKEDFGALVKVQNESTRGR